MHILKSWKNAINSKFGAGAFTVPQTKRAIINYGGMHNIGKIRLQSVTQYGLTIFLEGIKMKRKSFKILVLFLVALHIYLIFMRWIYWMLDYHYGDFDYIFLKLADVPNGFEVVDNLYNEVLFDIYYLAFSTIVTIIIAVKYLKQQKKKNEEDNHLH